MTLSQRELEVARLAADGLTNKEIAREIGIAPATVKCHVHAAIEKLGARRRAGFGVKLAELAA